jgi:hypothetical protein
MTSKWKYRISVRAVILSLSSYFVFPFVKPGDRLKVGGRVWFSVPDDLSLEEFTTFCSSFSAGADKRSTTSVSTAKRLADDATCEPTSCASSSFGAAKRSYTLTTSSICENGRCAFWISNRDRQKPGGRCLAGWAATPPEECGAPRGYMRILDQHKHYPPMAEQELVENALQYMAGVLPDQSPSRLAQGAARSRAGEGRTTAKNVI